MKISKNIKIKRDALTKERDFSAVFIGFETVNAVKKNFGKDTEKILSDLKVKPSGKWGYMWIDDKHGKIVINPKYFKTCNFWYIYLDIVHELVHIRQWREGKRLFYESHETYLEWPTEVEAYKVAVKEAKRIGVNKKELIKYLKMEHFDEVKFKNFLKVMKVS